MNEEASILWIYMAIGWGGICILETMLCCKEDMECVVDWIGK
jgi:hypothetical protein